MEFSPLAKKLAEFWPGPLTLVLPKKSGASVSDIVTAGSVNFTAVRGGRSTQVSVHLQYAPPGGKTGAFIASLFGREPSQTIREDLRRFKQVLEAGEIPRATAEFRRGPVS